MTVDEFLTIVGTECGVLVRPGDLSTDFDELQGWDSLNLLKLLVALEAATGRRLTVSRFFETRSLADVLRLAREAVS